MPFRPFRPAAFLAAALLAALGAARPAPAADEKQPLNLSWDSKGPYGIIHVSLDNATDREFVLSELKAEFVDKEGKILASLDGVYSEIRIREIKEDGKETWFPAPPKDPPAGEKPKAGYYPIGTAVDPKKVIVKPAGSVEIFLLGKMERHVSPDDWTPKIALKAQDGTILAYPAEAGEELKGGVGVQAVEMKGVDPTKEINVISMKKMEDWVVVEFALTNLSEGKLTVGSITGEFRGGTHGAVRYGSSRPNMTFDREGFTFNKERSDGKMITAFGVALAPAETRGFVIAGKPTGDAAFVNKVLVRVMSVERGDLHGEGEFKSGEAKRFGPAGGDDDDDDAKKPPKDPKKDPSKDGAKKPPEKKAPAGPDE